MNCVDGACEPTYNWWGNYWQLLLGENTYVVSYVIVIVIVIVLVSIKLSYCCSCYYHDHSCYHTWGCY